MTIIIMAVVCLATGLAIRLLRQLPRLVFVASLVGAIALAVLLASAAYDPVYFFGRSLALDASARLFLVPAISIAAALAFFGPLTFEHVSDAPIDTITNAQGAYFFWSLAPLLFAITLDSFPLAVFFWAVGLIILMLAAHSRREGRVGGTAQFLLLTVIASAMLLLANRFIDLYPLTPENLDLIRNTIVFLALGFGLLLAVVPLSIWFGPLADEMPLLGLAFLVGIVQPVGLWLLYQQMMTVPWLVSKSPLLEILYWGGIVTVPVGALLALGERRSGRWLAYLSLVSLGNALIGLSLGTQLGLIGAVFAIFNRAVGVALIAGGLAFVQHHAERRWQLIGAAAIVMGGFSLSGIPPLVGFASGYSVYRDLAATNPNAIIVLLVSATLVLFAATRVAWDIVRASRQVQVVSVEIKIVPYLCAVVVLLLMVITISVGLFPQWIGNSLIDTLGKAAYLK
ncbi:MAG: hypothetical protein HZB51_27110 [Chloroflexi bacterium]|nr:hypothetical protein [Chloroflexota bacterium]